MIALGLHHLTVFFDSHSLEQRYVAYVLGKEKTLLKETMVEVCFRI